MKRGSASGTKIGKRRSFTQITQDRERPGASVLQAWFDPGIRLL